MPGQVLRPDVNALIYQVPGGMLSNLLSQMKNANAMDKYEAVLAEVPRVRADFGYPPLVTQPDRGHPGGVQCAAGRALPLLHQGVKGAAGRVWPAAGRDQQEVQKMALG